MAEWIAQHPAALLLLISGAAVLWGLLLVEITDSIRGDKNDSW